MLELQRSVSWCDQLRVLAVTLHMHIRGDELAHWHEARATAFDFLEREFDELAADALSLKVVVDLGVRQ